MACGVIKRDKSHGNMCEKQRSVLTASFAKETSKYTWNKDTYWRNIYNSKKDVYGIVTYDCFVSDVLIISHAKKNYGCQSSLKHSQITHSFRRVRSTIAPRVFPAIGPLTLPGNIGHPMCLSNAKGMRLTNRPHGKHVWEICTPTTQNSLGRNYQHVPSSDPHPYHIWSLSLSLSLYIYIYIRTNLRNKFIQSLVFYISSPWPPSIRVWFLILRSDLQ